MHSELSSSHSISRVLLMSGVISFRVLFPRILKNWRDFLVNLAKNWSMVVSLPFRDWMSWITCVSLCLGSQRSFFIYLNTFRCDYEFEEFSNVTPNLHFKKVQLYMVFHSKQKVSSRVETWLGSLKDFTNIGTWKFIDEMLISCSCIF